jgi:hypothetical protein
MRVDCHAGWPPRNQVNGFLSISDSPMDVYKELGSPRQGGKSRSCLQPKS